VGTRGSFSVK